MPRPRKLKRNGAHLDTYGGIWNSSNRVTKTRRKYQLGSIRLRREFVRLTSAEEYYIESYDNTLAIANVSGFFGKR